MITKAEKIAYNNYVKEHQEEIEHVRAGIKEITSKMKSMPAIKGYLNIEAILDYIKIIKLYIKMNDISLDMLDKKNETFLNNARKEIYKIIQLAEEIVGNVIDRPLKENEDYLKNIDKVNSAQILNQPPLHSNQVHPEGRLLICSFLNSWHEQYHFFWLSKV